MILQITIATLATIVLYVLYFYFLKPWRKFNWYKSTLEKQGYKVYSVGWHPFGGRFVKIMKRSYQKDGDALKFVKQSSDFDIILSTLLDETVIMINNLDLIKSCLSPENSLIFHKEQKTAGIAAELANGGIIFAEDDRWKKSRKMITSVFTYDFVMEMIPMISQQCDLVFDQLQKSKIFPKVFIGDMLHQIFGNVVVKSFFGPEILQRQIDGMKISVFTARLLQQLGQAGRTIDAFIFGPRVLKLGYRERFRKLNQKQLKLKKVVTQFIKKKYEAVEKGQNTDKKNLIAKIYSAKKSNPEQYAMFDEQQICAQFVNLFFAGLETTAHLTTMMIYNLYLNPQVKKKTLSQIDNVIKSDQDVLEVQKLKQLSYVDLVQKETLRHFGPGIGLITRRASRDTFINDIKILKNTIIVPQFLPSHYNEKIFKNPYQFNPDRWTNKQQVKNYPELFFSGGLRNCAGKQLALTQSKIALVKFLRRYDYVLSKTDFKLQVKFAYQAERFETILTKK